MQCRRFRRLVLLSAVGTLLTPPLLWALIVLVAPTSWARSHVIAALEDHHAVSSLSEAKRRDGAAEARADDDDVRLVLGLRSAHARSSGPYAASSAASSRW